MSDYDTAGTRDSDPQEGVINVSNIIPIVVNPGECDDDNDFVDRNNGSISGTVMDGKGTVLLDVEIKLQKPDGTVVMTTTTDSNLFTSFLRLSRARTLSRKPTFRPIQSM